MGPYFYKSPVRNPFPDTEDGRLIITDHQEHSQSTTDNLSADVRVWSVRIDPAALIEQVLHSDVGREHNERLGA